LLIRMSDDWRSALVERLCNAEHYRSKAAAGGGWGYRSGCTGSAEPTALAALALTALRQSPDRVVAALQWLARLQRRDGAVAVSVVATSANWPTALALLAWLRCAQPDPGHYLVQTREAINWLTSARGRKVPPNPALYDHDTTLVGWPWVTGCHSWLEPTAYAILALRAAGKAHHPRVREGVRLILDRALPAGGWNYGNRRVLEHVLRPFPATTGVALAALAGEPRDARIDAALAYLASELGQVRAPLSLAWGLIGMRAWNAQPLETKVWLSACARRLLKRPAMPHYDALLLLAGAKTCPLIVASEAQIDG
jgi:hypothetical protein